MVRCQYDERCASGSLVVVNRGKVAVWSYEHNMVDFKVVSLRC